MSRDRIEPKWTWPVWRFRVLVGQDAKTAIAASVANALTCIKSSYSKGETCMKLQVALVLLIAALAFTPLVGAEQTGTTEMATTDGSAIATHKDETEATCTAEAYCEETGTYISCTGTTDCHAEDQDCDAGVRGHIYCSGSDVLQACPACPIDCTGYPPMGKCIDGWSCKPGCDNCGLGSCLQGECNCRA